MHLLNNYLMLKTSQLCNNAASNAVMCVNTVYGTDCIVSQPKGRGV